MDDKSFNLKDIENIIMNPIKNVERVRCGYTNEVYSINDEYVLKICTNEKNYQNFKRASLFCGKYFEKINCPQILFSNLDIEHNNVWRLEKKVKGENLFYKWDDFSQIERQNILKKICDEQKKIHSIPILDVFEKNFKNEEWKNKFEKDIYKKIDTLRSKGIGPETLYKKIKSYVSKSLDVLDETNFSICHTDMHFDNIMIDEDNNITILDYDRLRIASIDYELNIFNVMERSPKLIANKEINEKINEKNYHNILCNIHKNYNELFQFDNLNGRLSIYAIKQYLGLLSVTQEPKKIILELEDLISCKDIIKNREHVIEER